MPLLKAEDIHTYYGAIKAVRGVSFYLDKGEIVTLIGANGAGKTTILKTIAGILRPNKGNIYFNDLTINSKTSNEIVKMGISLAPEGRQIFPRSTVKQNLLLGAYTINDRKLVQDGLERTFEMFPILKERCNQLGGTLSGGEQQMLAIARALMSNPKLLMLDEPSLGLAPIIVEQLFQIICTINRTGTTVLLVEQNARMALSISTRGYVIETGTVVLSDTGEKLMSDPKVKEAYLGG